MKVLDQIIAGRKSIIVIGAILLLAITFETFQQLYYIHRYDLAKGVTFWDLLQGQSYRWLVWLLYGLILFRHVKRYSSNQEITFRDMGRYVLVIVALVVLSILTIAILDLVMDGFGWSWQLLTDEYIPFFTFQKAPIYFLGYIAVAIILHLHFSNELLQVEVQKLSEVKKTNEALYHRLRTKLDDKTTVLDIKVGNKRKIIPVAEISWLEADDYCVRVHTISGASYSMRSSLKAMEQKLTGNFLRVHRKAIANMDLVRELSLAHPPKLTLSNDATVPVSKSNLKLVRDRIS